MTYTGNERYVRLIFHTQASCCRVIARMGVDDVPSALYHPTTVRRIIDSCRRKASLVRCLRTGCTPYPGLWYPSTCVSVRFFRRFGGKTGFVATRGSVCRHPVLAVSRAARASAFPLRFVHGDGGRSRVAAAQWRCLAFERLGTHRSVRRRMCMIHVACFGPSCPEGKHVHE